MLPMSFFIILVFLTLHDLPSASPSDGADVPWYDPSAYSKCQTHPEEPLYGGGLLKNLTPSSAAASHSPAFELGELTAGTRYAFSCWLRIKGAGAASAVVMAKISIDNATTECAGSALASSGCWSFLKGGFVLEHNSSSSVLFFKAAVKGVSRIRVASASLQPFTAEQWKMHQEANINRVRKREVVVHVSDGQGNRIPGASVKAWLLSKDFPFGSAIAAPIIGNMPYQSWFMKRFGAAVFENELKWYATESRRGELNYTLADELLGFAKANKIVVRGHNIFWEDPEYVPEWVRELSGADELRAAVDARLRSLMSRYKEDFIHWDVINEMLHFDFYEQRLGRNASLGFFEAAREMDPLAAVFVNDYNVVETCGDARASVDSYVARVRELVAGGAGIQGIGLEGHFSVPNVPLMRGVLDKLATLELPVWLTEVDISNDFDLQQQAVYLEEVLREGFSHPTVDGIMLWAARHPEGCYRMCLTDGGFVNLPTGDAVDALLREWETKGVSGATDGQGSFAFDAFLGEYGVSVGFGSRSVSTTLALGRGDETKHLEVVL